MSSSERNKADLLTPTANGFKIAQHRLSVSRSLARKPHRAPSRYHMNLRTHEAKRLLRETKQSVVAVGLDVGYANPSHFAQLFRRETGLSPSDYRRQR